MRLKLILGLCIVNISFLFAQTNGKIYGKIIDSQTNETIPFATLIIKNNDVVITTDVSDLDGNFSIANLPLQTLEITTQFIGFKNLIKVVTLTPKENIINLGTLSLQSQDTQLEEVTIVAERSTTEQKIDRKVINVGRDLTTVGATASEIMNNIPSVNVDQDGKLSLRGNSNVRVLVDGRPTNMDVALLLKQIPSTAIKSIEIITNPSAKYNPEGMSGIINIVLHKNAMDGFNGSFATGITFAKKTKFNNSFNANYRKGKVNFFTTLGNNLGDYVNGGEIYTDADKSNQLLNVTNTNKNEFYKVGLDYFINEKNTLSVYTNQSYANAKFGINTDIFFDNNTAAPYFSNDNFKAFNRNSIYNLAYKKLFTKEGETLDFEATFNQASGNQNSYYFPNGINTNQQDYSRANDKSTVVNLDYTNPLSDNINLELGAEARITETNNIFTTNRTGLENANFSYNFNIYSAYATLGQKFEKLSYQVGARFENYEVKANYQTTTQSAPFKNSYFTVYPSAYLNYTVNENNSLNLSLSRRVDRPSINQTKPIRNFSTPRITSYGNPELLPQFTNSIELVYSKKINKSSINASLFYRDIHDEIAQVFLNDENANPNEYKLVQTYTNFKNNSSFGFEVSANIKLTSWWDMQPSIDYSSIKQNGQLAVYDTNNNTFQVQSKTVNTTPFNTRLNNTFKITNKLKLTWFGFYRSSITDIQNVAKPMYKTDIGARYTFWDQKATINVRFNDVFNTMRYRYNSTNPYPGTGNWHWESQSVYVGFNIAFGGGKTKSLQRKNRETNESNKSGGLF